MIMNMCVGWICYDHVHTNPNKRIFHHIEPAPAVNVFVAIIVWLFYPNKNVCQ